MPFITLERRQLIAEHGMPKDWQPGDLCYVEYKHMVEAWRENPRWTTAHEIYRDNVLRARRYVEGEAGRNTLALDHVAACELAWQVLFQMHILPYELEKRKENGDV